MVLIRLKNLQNLGGYCIDLIDIIFLELLGSDGRRLALSLLLLFFIVGFDNIFSH